jgi:voltage-gated potassium channel
VALHPIQDVERRAAETRRFQRRLFTAQAIGTGTRLLRRFVFAVAVFLVVLGVLWLDRDGLKDHFDGHISFGDLIYFTFVTITTVGYGDIVPVTDRARMIDALLVTPARLVFIMIFVGTAYELVIQRWVETFRMERLQANLRDHVVICGFGAGGQMAAREILARGTPPTQIVVIDVADGPLEDAADLGLTGLRGDASRADVLQDAAVTRARGVIVCAGDDPINALISLAVRRETRTTRLVVAAEGLDTKPIMQQSGADAVVSAPMIGGYVLADALESPGVADLLVDILSASGEVEWREIDVAETQIGQPPQHLRECVVIAVRRDARLLWPWQPEAQRLAAGDRLVVVRATQSTGVSRAAPRDRSV